MTHGESLVLVNNKDLTGCAFLLPKDNDGQQHRACIVEAIQDQRYKAKRQPDVGTGLFLLGGGQKGGRQGEAEGGVRTCTCKTKA